MNDKQFWSVVEIARKTAGSNVGARVETLRAELRRLSAAEIQQFQQRYDEKIRRANRWDLVEAAALMNGGSTDDSFRYFCHWLVSEGQMRFDAALANPDSLADVPRRKQFELELYAYAAFEVYGERGAGELERDFTIELESPEGVELTAADRARVLPRLSAKYSD